MKLFNKIMAMTALLGWLPPLLCLLVIRVALAHGADTWPSVIYDTVFVGLYLAFLGTGAYIYATWFKG